ncbi:MAG: peptidase C45 [Planctomycetota bacterium]|nr:MAG: peptidase C45 [Planctomycetota bacterium]
MPSTRYPEFTVSGPPRELGRQLGEAAREQIVGFCEAAMANVNRTVKISREAAMRAAANAIPHVEQYAPHILEELRGTADAAGVTLEDLMLLQVRNQLQPEESACTSFSIAGAGRTGDIVAQNWDNDPNLDEFTIVLTRRPEGKPALTTVTQAGLVAYIGFNDAGIGLCLNSLPAPKATAGVPHYFTVREIYESDSLDGAVQAVRRATRVIPANIMLSTPQGPADLEVTINDVHVLTPNGSDKVTHTNHCRHPELIAINDQFPELIQSHDRQARIDELLSAADSVEGAQAALKDHQGHPRSICRHPNDDAETGAWVTVFSVVIEPRQQRMHLTRGTPCDHPYETYEMGTE